MILTLAAGITMFHLPLRLQSRLWKAQLFVDPALTVVASVSLANFWPQFALDHSSVPNWPFVCEAGAAVVLLLANFEAAAQCLTAALLLTVVFGFAEWRHVPEYLIASYVLNHKQEDFSISGSLQ
jgi:hypothetical protein